MPTTISKTYVDRLFAERDFGEIYWAISVVEESRPLPEEFWLFSRIYEWAPARSGVWQYYEGLSEELFTRVSEDLNRFGLSDIAEKYRFGRSTRDGQTQAAEVDRWLDLNADKIHDAVFKLIVDKKYLLTNEK